MPPKKPAKGASSSGAASGSAASSSGKGKSGRRPSGAGGASEAGKALLPAAPILEEEPEDTRASHEHELTDLELLAAASETTRRGREARQRRFPASFTRTGAGAAGGAAVTAVLSDWEVEPGRPRTMMETLRAVAARLQVPTSSWKMVGEAVREDEEGNKATVRKYQGTRLELWLKNGERTGEAGAETRKRGSGSGGAVFDRGGMPARCVLFSVPSWGLVLLLLYPPPPRSAFFPFL